MICEKISNVVNNKNFSSTGSFFFIVEHTNDKIVVEEYAKSIISQIPSHSVEFAFFGLYAEQWEFAFDLADVMLRSENPNNKVVLTSVYKTWESFADEITEANSFQDGNIALFYDDKSMCDSIMKYNQTVSDFIFSEEGESFLHDFCITFGVEFRFDEPGDDLVFDCFNNTYRIPTETSVEFFKRRILESKEKGKNLLVTEYKENIVIYDPKVYY